MFRLNSKCCSFSLRCYVLRDAGCVWTQIDLYLMLSSSTMLISQISKTPRFAELAIRALKQTVNRWAADTRNRTGQAFLVTLHIWTKPDRGCDPIDKETSRVLVSYRCFSLSIYIQYTYIYIIPFFIHIIYIYMYIIHKYGLLFDAEKNMAQGPDLVELATPGSASSQRQSV